MQANVSNKVKLGQSLDPLQDETGVDSVDFSADIDNLLKKLEKLPDLYEKGRIDSDLLRYIQGMSKIMYQGQIDWIQTKKPMPRQPIPINKYWNLTLN